MESNNKILYSILRLLLIFAIIISLLGFCRDFKNTFEYGGIDFRANSVAAKLLIEGEDPYHFKWSQNKSDTLLDPNDYPNKPVSRVTSLPTVFLIYMPISKLPYKVQRVIWFIFQWVLLLLSIILFSKSSNSKVKSKMIWIIGLLLISGTPFWRLHVERGQAYIIYVFLISFAYWLSFKTFKYIHILSGFFIGLTASYKPTVLFMIIPMIIYRKWKFFIGTVVGIFSGIASSFIIADISIWKKYISAIQFYGNNPDTFRIDWGNTYKEVYPNQIIEGWKNLSSALFIPTTDSSIQGIFFKFLKVKLYPNVLIISLFLTLLFISIILYRFYIKNLSTSMLFLIGIVIVFVSEFFQPSERYTYYDVLWFIPLSLIVINSEPLISLLNPLVILFFIGVFFSISIPFVPGGVLISDYAILTYAIVATSFLLKKRWQSENAILLGNKH